MRSSASEPRDGDLRAALDAAEPRPPDDASRDLKKNYAQRLSRALASEVAHRLRPAFPNISPTCGDEGQEREIGGAGGTKRLDVCVWDDRMGLLLDVSIKTYSFRDYDTRKRRLGRWTKNVVRNDIELRAEAARMHERQPYAVLVGLMFAPLPVCDDGKREPSSFAHMVMTFRSRAGRLGHDDKRFDRFEAFYIGLYERDGDQRGRVRFFDVAKKPPRNGRPKQVDTITLPELVQTIGNLVDARNTKDVEWAEPEDASD